jgi:hypothetical protein
LTERSKFDTFLENKGGKTMALLSKKKLFQALKDEFGLNVDLKSNGISDETYGKDSMIYIYWNKFGIDRREAEAKLESLGFKVDRRYDPGSQTSEIQVSYFQGTRHWE